MMTNNNSSSNDCIDFIAAYDDIRVFIFNGLIGVYNRLLLLFGNNTINIIHTITDISKAIISYVGQEGKCNLNVLV